MAIFEKILVAYDGSSYSEKAAKKAIEFMDQDESVETHVITVTRDSSMDLYGDKLSEVVEENLQKEAERIIEKAKNQLADYKEKTYFKTLKGHIPKEIIDYGTEHDVDVIILGSHGVTAFKEMSLGSVSFQVTQLAACPTLLIT